MSEFALSWVNTVLTMVATFFLFRTWQFNHSNVVYWLFLVFLYSSIMKIVFNLTGWTECRNLLMFPFYAALVFVMHQFMVIVMQSLNYKKEDKFTRLVLWLKRVFHL